MGEFLANSNSKPGMAELKQIMYNSLALSTRSIYQTALKKFQEFSRAHHSLPSWSLSISTLFQFIAYLPIQQHASSTLQLYIYVQFHFITSSKRSSTLSGILSMSWLL